VTRLGLVGDDTHPVPFHPLQETRHRGFVLDTLVNDPLKTELGAGNTLLGKLKFISTRCPVGGLPARCHLPESVLLLNPTKHAFTPLVIVTLTDHAAVHTDSGGHDMDVVMLAVLVANDAVLGAFKAHLLGVLLSHRPPLSVRELLPWRKRQARMVDDPRHAGPEIPRG